MNNMELQREAIIEIVGTQYEGRAENHQQLFLQQRLILKHQINNLHDHNAVILLTDDGKELGFLPKGYASLYAPAIDSGRYSFSIEIVKSEPDPERPILIVKITSELKNHSEEEIESDILELVQNIVNGYGKTRTEYLSFIYSDTVSSDKLLSVLDKVRLIQKLCSCANDLIKYNNIVQKPDEYTPISKDLLTKHISDLKADVNDILKKIQKAYNESLDIDDEDEYHRVQSEIRERRKRFRSYDELLTSLLDTATSYVNVNIKAVAAISEAHESELKKSVANNIDTTAETVPVVSESVQTVTTPSEPETKIQDSSQLTEQVFFDWLVSEGGVTDSTAKQYISNIHSIEKLYQTLFGIRKNIIGAASSDNVKSMLETLVQKSEYIDANDRRHNSFSVSLSKFAQFAGISIDGIKEPSERKTYQPPISSEPYVIKTVNFDNPHNCTYYKPCSFILNELRYSVGSWRELYTKFLILLYTDNNYSEIIKGLNGKSLYGHRMDFADKTLSHELRRPIRVSTNFFAEGNLSAVDIIKRIKCLMDLCSIDNEHMIIEYSTQEKDNNPILPDDSDYDDIKGIQQLTIASEPGKNNTGNETKETIDTDFSEKKTTITDEERIAQDSFIEWLTSVFGLTPEKAQSYCSSITSSERIAREQNLKSQRLLSAQSYAEAKETFDELLKCDAFIKMNATAHNSLTAGVRKLISYMLATKSSTQTSVQETTQPESPSITEDTASIPATFNPDTKKLFVLKDAIIEILLSEAPEITKFHEYKGGISSKNLRELIKGYYGKSIGLFEISKLLMLDRTFQSVGKGCYVLNESMIPHKEAEPEHIEQSMPEKAEPAKVEIETVQINPAPVTSEVQFTNTAIIQADESSAEDLTIESIIEVIKENSDNLQYEDGFGAYEVKTLLSHKGIKNVSEEQIETLMSECPKLQEIDDGYYALSEDDSEYNTIAEPVVVTEDKSEIVEPMVSDTVPTETQEITADSRHIVLSLNGKVIRAYDYSDALNKVCEFSINCKPFRMARIAGQAIQIHGNSVFYRKAVPVDGYNKLSNGLQIITITTLSDLQMITAAVQKYCQIDDDMISIISK
jgi:hypothetical protein